jgi:hypothetical protein
VNSNSSLATTYSVGTSIGATETIVEQTQYAILFAPPAEPAMSTWAVSIPTVSWNTTAVFGGLLGTLQEFFVTNPPGQGVSAGAIYFTNLQAGVQAVPAATTQLTLAITVPGITPPFGFFCAPDWNTQVAVISKTASQVTLAFSDPPPADQNLYFAFQKF